MGATRRWRLGAAAVLLAVAGACSSDDGGGDGPGTSQPADPTSTTVAPGNIDYGVGESTVTLVDSSRSTPAVAGAGLAAQPSRTVDVTVLYPTTDGEAADGPFPLVVFAHGWNGSGDNFVDVGSQWAEAGYVVALPTFPLSREGIAFGDDYLSQSGDISFVIDELAAGDANLPFAGLVDPEHVAVGGHSLGSSTVFRAAYNACCVDDRIDATFPVSGGPADIGQGGYETWPQTPMLLVHGVLDQAVPIAVGDGVFELVQVPVRYLRMDEADHNSVFTGANGDLFAGAVLAFLDATVGGDDTGFDRLADVVDASGIAELRTRVAG